MHFVLQDMLHFLLRTKYMWQVYTYIYIDEIYERINLLEPKLYVWFLSKQYVISCDIYF